MADEGAANTIEFKTAGLVRVYAICNMCSYSDYAAAQNRPQLNAVDCAV